MIGTTSYYRGTTTVLSLFIWVSLSTPLKEIGHPKTWNSVYHVKKYSEQNKLVSTIQWHMQLLTVPPSPGEMHTSKMAKIVSCAMSYMNDI